MGDGEELEAAVSAGISTYVHTTSTAPIDGLGDEWAVVGASIVPEVPSTVSDATTIMIAEHIARRVCGS
ncbi:hypothetical protein ACFY5F_44285 [Streptomyces sp. NPDC013161]|uniref:hypothetical protein n=1 Tax=Streptomyces sp. NPDC013161 TaxID=3364862 RepID=UPI0036B0C9FF